MSLAPDSILVPSGRLHPDLFPERSVDQLEEDIESWLTDAYADVRVAALSSADQDRAAREWAYYRGFDAACVAMSANPSTSSQADAGGSSYAKDQRDRVCRYAAEALARFDEIAPSHSGAVRRTGGQTVTHEFAW